MNDQLRVKIRRTLDPKGTDDLLHIWMKHDKEEWSDLDFEIIREILEDRKIELPPIASKVNWYKIDPKGKWLLDIDIEDLEEYRPHLEEYYQLLNFAQSNGDQRREGECHIELGKTFKKMTFFLTAIEHFEQALVIFRDLLYKNQQVTVLTHIGKIHFLLRQNKAVEYYQQSLKICREIHNRDKEAAQLMNIGSFYAFLTNETNKAIEYFNQALSIYRELSNLSEEARVLNFLASAYFQLNQLEQATKCNEKILINARKTSIPSLEAAAYNTLGMVYFRQSKNKRAIEYYLKSIRINRETGNRFEEAANLENMGCVYSELGQLDKAIVCAQNAILILKEIGHPRLIEAQKALDTYKKIANKKWWQFW